MEAEAAEERDDAPETPSQVTELAPSDEAAGAASAVVVSVAANESGSPDNGSVLQEGAAPAPSDTQEASSESTTTANAAPPPLADDATATSAVDNVEMSVAPSSDTSVVDPESTELPAIGTPAPAESDAPTSRGSENGEGEVPRVAADEASTSPVSERSGSDGHPQQRGAEDQSPDPTSSAINGPTSGDTASTSEVSATSSSATSSTNPTAPPGPRRTFLASLTAQFAPETKRAWADVFGVRYESGEATASESDRSKMTKATNSPASRPSVRANTARTADAGESRQRGEQIQTTQHRYRDRIRQLTVAAAQQGKPQQSPSTRRTAKPAPGAPTWTHCECDGTSPLEQSGLSLTQIRFCQGRALDETYRTFRQIHVDLLNDGGPEREHSQRQLDVQHGVFLTQWELEQALRDSQVTGDDGVREGSAIDPVYAEIPIETLLQASWFLLFDQLPRLRTLVLQITRRHLNEHRLARLNRFLRKQLLWIPHSAKLQQLVIGLTATPQDGQEGRGCELGTDKGATVAEERRTQRDARLQSDPALIREFVEYIVACPRVPGPTDATYGAFLSSPPVVKRPLSRLCVV